MGARIRAALAATMLLTLATAGAVSAHNEAFVRHADGSCTRVGSGREAPMVGAPWVRAQLDLVPETQGRDEYGARFAANHVDVLLDPGQAARLCASFD